jgi:antitoxin (DNA-binding transcriptional repressor) of toxin-antitoxin stability system
MGSTHISAEEAALNLSALIARVHAGEEIIIDNGSLTVAVVPSAAPVRRSVSECIAIARRHEEISGSSPVFDPDFATDVNNIVRDRKPWNPPAWD